VNARFVRERVSSDDGLLAWTCWPVSVQRSWLVGEELYGPDACGDTAADPV
jgi:hypothetical protein